jgi:uncharacterized protein YajQ (UPF0234 family)
MAAKDSSFDIVSDFDQQELVNALDQTKRDVATRFDLKDSGSTLEIEEEKQIVLTTTDDFRAQNIFDILEGKVVKRGLNAMILDKQDPEPALGGKVRQVIKLKRGLEIEQSKKIVAAIKEAKLKVQASIQGDQVRVSGKSRDDLQAAMQAAREIGERLNMPLQFENYR